MLPYLYGGRHIMYIYMDLDNSSVRVILGDISAWMGQFSIVPDVRRTIWARGHWSILHRYMFYSLILSTVW